ncbi:MAG: O-succinylbenzoate synthase, partial [Aquiluna sp.]
MSVVRLPLRSRFRGIDYREALIFKGSQRYSEFSP